MSSDKGYVSARVLGMEVEHSFIRDSLSVKLELHVPADQIREFKRMFGVGISDIVIALAPSRMPSTLDTTIGPTAKVKELEESEEFGTW